jgi:glycosyltransferase involved in cell wall biosynthesis
MQEQETQIKFSVIIPAYNAAGTIVRAIDGVLAQSYTNYEIIVVDDASKDDTCAIITERYGDTVQLIQKVTNSGSSIARNTAMDVATGQYIAFLDADDVWHKDKLDLVHTILVSQPNITLFYHPYTQEAILDKRLPEDIQIYRLPFIKLLPANPVATSCAVLRNDPSFRFDPAMRYAEDYDLWLRVSYKHKLYFIDIPLTQIYRAYTSKGGISENRWKMRRGEMRAYTKLIRLNPLFLIVLPVFITSSIGKYFYKMIVKTPNPSR